MYCSLFLLLVMVTVVLPLYVPIIAEDRWELNYSLEDENELSPMQLELGEEFVDDFSVTTEGTHWQNAKTDNVWIHDSLSNESSALLPPGDRGFIEIDYPSGTVDYAHYHTKGLLTFPRGGILQLDYWLTANMRADVELKVNFVRNNNHNLVPLADLTVTFNNSPVAWQSASIAIPASEDQLQICIQGHRKRLLTTGLAIAKIVVRSNEDFIDDYSNIVTSTTWVNDKTENVWIHSSLSEESSASLRPPTNEGFVEINYPSNTTSYAHYHTVNRLAFPNGGILQLDYWLAAKSRTDVQLKVNIIKGTVHDLTPLSDLTPTYMDPERSYWQSANITIPASAENILICIQGHRKRLSTNGLAIARIQIHNNSIIEIPTTEASSSSTTTEPTTAKPTTAWPTTTTQVSTTTQKLTTHPSNITAEPITVEPTTAEPTTTTQVSTTTQKLTTHPKTETDSTITQADILEMLDDYTEIVNSTNWQNNRVDNIWVHSSVSEQSDAVLRPPEGKGFIEINYPSGNNSYAHYHSINYFMFPNGGTLQLDYWLQANAKSDAQIRVFILQSKSHATTLADILNENPESGWQSINIQIPASEAQVQICIQGHRRQIDSTGLAIAKILVRNYSNIALLPTEAYSAYD